MDRTQSIRKRNPCRTMRSTSASRGRAQDDKTRSREATCAANFRCNGLDHDQNLVPQFLFVYEQILKSVEVRVVLDDLHDSTV